MYLILNKLENLQCVSMIQETISYYVNNGSHVIMCMLDESQASDCVNLLTLFKKLRGIYLKTLIQMYRTQSLRIDWNIYIYIFHSNLVLITA